MDLPEAIDNLGAGDAFISRFLAETLKGTRRDERLVLATESASEACTYFGAYGHGIENPEL